MVISYSKLVLFAIELMPVGKLDYLTAVLKFWVVLPFLMLRTWFEFWFIPHPKIRDRSMLVPKASPSLPFGLAPGPYEFTVCAMPTPPELPTPKKLHKTSNR